MAQQLFGGLNVAHALSKKKTLDENSPDFTYQLPTGKAVAGVIVDLDADLSIATGEDKVLDEGVAKLLANLGVKWNSYVAYPNSFDGRDHLRVQRNMTAQALRLDEPADATSQTDTDIGAEFIIWFSFPIVGKAQKHLFLGPAGGNDTFQVEGKWETAKTNSSSDAGSGAVIKDSDSSGNPVTFPVTPTVTLTPLVIPNPPALPWGLPKVRKKNSKYTSAEEALEVDIDHDYPTLATKLTAAQNGSDRDLYDGIDLVTLGDRSDFTRVDYNALSIEERRRFAAASRSRLGELGIVHTQGTLGTAMIPERDLESQDLKLKTLAPSGDGRASAYFVGYQRDGLEVGETVRENVEMIPEGVAAAVRENG